MYGGEWGTVCGWTFGTQETEVACRSLGFKAGWVYPLGPPRSPKKVGAVLLDGVRCVGDEWALEMCDHYGWGKLTTRCKTHKWDVWLHCEPVLPEEEVEEVVKAEEQRDEDAAMQRDENTVDGGTGGEGCDKS